jgi:hypothetical protein
MVVWRFEQAHRTDIEKKTTTALINLVRLIWVIQPPWGMLA